LAPTSTLKEENEFGVEDNSVEVEAADASMDVDDTELDVTILSSDIATSPPFALLSDDKDDMISSNSIIKEENGKIIVEKLDTPAIRKQQRAQRKKEEKRRAAQYALPEFTSGSNVDPHVSVSPRPGPSRLPDEAPSDAMEVAIDAGSDLSDLSEMGSEDARGRVPRRKPLERIRVQPSRNTRSHANAALEPGTIVLDDDTMLEGGTLGMFQT
jgi:hypothetical protein